jgi:hypothetical protein
MARWPSSAMRALAIGLLAFAVVELRPHYDLMPTPTAEPPIYAALPADRQTVIVDLPLPAHDGDYWIDPTYLYYSTFHWRRLVNGYSGFIPVWYPRLMVAAREFPSDDALAVFRKAGAQYAVVHEEFYGDRYREIVDALDRRDDVELVATRPWPAGEQRLYRLRPAAGAADLRYAAPADGGRGETAVHRAASR